MMARSLAHKPDPGNGVGLHYSRFRRYSTFPVPANQLLAPAKPHENPGYRPPIREVGLTQCCRLGACALVVLSLPRLCPPSQIRRAAAVVAPRTGRVYQAGVMSEFGQTP